MDRGGRLQVRERGGDRRSGSEARLPALPGPPPLPRVPRPRPSGRPRQGRHRASSGRGRAARRRRPRSPRGFLSSAIPTRAPTRPRRRESPPYEAQTRHAEWCARDATPAIPPVTMPALAFGRLEQCSPSSRRHFRSPVPSRLLSRLFASRSRYLPPAVPAARGTSRGTLDDVADDVSRAWSPFSRIPPPLSRSFARARATLPASRRI